MQKEIEKIGNQKGQGHAAAGRPCGLPLKPEDSNKDLEQNKE